ncbi:hypothetical protein BDW69DRAFT_189486 [Aspergillus filifer]
MALGQTNDSASVQAQRTRVCTGCADAYMITELAILPCNDKYCASCLKRLFDTALKSENRFPPRCCDAIPLKSVRAFLEEETLKEYIKKKAEHEAKDRMYCSGCSAFICAEYVEGDVAICPECGAMTCIACRNRAHENDCPEDKGQQALIETARKKGWRQCWACRRMVERISGCSAIQCRCGAVFCYICGEPFTKNKPLCACNGFQALYIGGALPFPNFVSEPEWFPEDNFPPIINPFHQQRLDQRRLGLVGGTVPPQYQQGYNSQGLPRDTNNMSAKTSENRVVRGAQKLDPSAPNFIPRGLHYQDSTARFSDVTWLKSPALGIAESVDDEIYTDWSRAHDARVKEDRQRLRSPAPTPSSMQYGTALSEYGKNNEGVPDKRDTDWTAQEFRRARRGGGQGLGPFGRI